MDNLLLAGLHKGSLYVARLTPRMLLQTDIGDKDTLDPDLTFKEVLCKPVSSRLTFQSPIDTENLIAVTNVLKHYGYVVQVTDENQTCVSVVPHLFDDC